MHQIGIPGDDYGVSSTINVADNLASRTTPFQEGEDDEGIPTTLSSPPTNAQDIRIELPTRPIIRARAKNYKIR